MNQISASFCPFFLCKLSGNKSAAEWWRCAVFACFVDKKLEKKKLGKGEEGNKKLGKIAVGDSSCSLMERIGCFVQCWVLKPRAWSVGNIWVFWSAEKQASFTVTYVTVTAVTWNSLISVCVHWNAALGELEFTLWILLNSIKKSFFSERCRAEWCAFVVGQWLDQVIWVVFPTLMLLWFLISCAPSAF